EVARLRRPVVRLVAEPSRVHRALAAALEGLEVAVQPVLDAEGAPEVAARPLPDQADARVDAPGLAGEQDAVAHLVERAVAADRDDERMPGLGARAGELDAVPAPLGPLDVDR